MKRFEKVASLLLAALLLAGCTAAEEAAQPGPERKEAITDSYEVEESFTPENEEDRYG